MNICSTTDKSCRISRCVGMTALVAIGIAALGWVVMLLWNWLLPTLFVGVQPVSYCQALGVLLLCKILFGSFRCCRCRQRQPRGENMTQDEREQLRSRLASRWGNWCGTPKQDEASFKGESANADQR